MVTVTEEDVYEILRFRWREGDVLLEDLKEDRGLRNLKLQDKLKYWASFQSTGIHEIEFYFHLNRLIKKGYAERSQDHIEDASECQYRKSSKGKPVRIFTPLLPRNLEERLFPSS